MTDQQNEHHERRVLAAAGRRWANLRAIEGPAGHQILCEYMDVLRRLRNDHHCQAVTTISDTLIEYLQNMIDYPADGETTLQKVNYLSYVLNDKDLCRTIKHTEDGVYALVTFAVLSALILKTDTSVSLNTDVIDELTAHIAGTDYVEDFALPDEDAVAQEVLAKQAAYITRQLMTPEWCVLVEPALTTYQQVVQAVWVERPPLQLSIPTTSMNNVVVPGIALPDMGYV